jgi:hypothetical protein
MDVPEVGGDSHVPQPTTSPPVSVGPMRNIAPFGDTRRTTALVQTLLAG